MWSTCSGVTRGSGEAARPGCHHFGATPLYHEKFKIAAKNVLRCCCKRQSELHAFKSIKAFAAKSDFFYYLHL